MRRSSVVGQCRFAARRWSTQSRLGVPIARFTASSNAVSYGVRTFHASAAVASKPKGSLIVDPERLQEPSDASRKLFSEFAFAFECVSLSSTPAVSLRHSGMVSLLA